MTKRWVIYKRSRLYGGGPSYNGLSLARVGVQYKEFYTSKRDAEDKARLLSEVNPVGFVVLPYIPLKSDR